MFSKKKINIEKLTNANKNLFYFQQRFKRKKHYLQQFFEKKNKKVNKIKITKLFKRKYEFK